MPDLEGVLASLAVWEQPADSDNPFKLACRIEPGTSREEIRAAFVDGPPEELVVFWLASREAWLFEDVDYGQWGLHILSPTDSAARTRFERESRSDDFRSGDIVLGEFLGDLELLVYAPAEESARRYLIALPLDPRNDWYPAGTSVAELLQGLLASDGKKFWEDGRA